jgi:hypothetical protein
MTTYRGAFLRHASFFRDLLKQANELYRSGGAAFEQGLELYLANAPNIRSGQSWTEKNATEDLQAARICEDYAGSAPTYWQYNSPRANACAG